MVISFNLNRPSWQDKTCGAPQFTGHFCVPASFQELWPTQALKSTSYHKRESKMKKRRFCLHPTGPRQASHETGERHQRPTANTEYPISKESDESPCPDPDSDPDPDPDFDSDFPLSQLKTQNSKLLPPLSSPLYPIPSSSNLDIGYSIALSRIRGRHTADIKAGCDRSATRPAGSGTPGRT